MMVKSSLQSPLFVALLAPPSQRDQRHSLPLGIFPDARHFVTVEFRHANVQQCNLGFEFSERGHGRATVVDDLDLMTVDLKQH